MQLRRCQKTPKAGQYADEIHYCNAEINRRKNTQSSKSKAKLLEEFCRKHEIKTVVVGDYIQAIAKFENDSILKGEACQPK